MNYLKKSLIKTFAVTGATGQIGKALTEKLLAAGADVRILTRDAAKAKDLVAKGALAFVGAVGDVAVMTDAFRGVDAVFAMTPPNYAAADHRGEQNRVGAKIAEALVAAGVTHVVDLSSVGAHLGEGAGVIDGLADQEKRLNAIASLNVVHLRPASFMENLAFTLAPIRTMNVVGTPLAGDAKAPMIATVDIAQKAAEFLLAGFTGKRAVELLGERDVSMEDVTAALRAALKRPELKYVQFPYDAAKSAMVGGGFSPNAADMMVAMYRAANTGFLKPESARTTAATTPTSIEAFTQGFAPLV